MAPIDVDARSSWRARTILPAVAIALVALSDARAVYLDPPALHHGAPTAVTLLDLTPPRRLLTPGVLSPRAGRVTLRPGPSAAGVYFLPNRSLGLRLCFGGSNPAIAGVGCVFTDNWFAPGIGWHGEFIVHNPNPLAGVAFNAAFQDGWGNVYAGPAVLGPSSTLYVDMHLADGSLPHFRELGVPQAWMASRVPPAAAPLGLDVSFTIHEGVLVNDATRPCPLRVAVVQGPTPQGSFNCVFGFATDPSDDWTAGPDDPSLPSLSIMDPNDKVGNADVFPDLAPISHFQCYELKPRAFARRTVALRDVFGAVDAGLVTTPNRLCAPAEELVGDEELDAPSFPDHLVGYPVRHAFTSVAGVTVTTEFGDVVVDVTRPDRLMVPSAKSHQAPPAPLDPAAIDHFQCYRLRPTSGSPRFTPIPGVQVVDQLGPTTVTLRRPRRLCVPADKNGESPGAEQHAMGLLCYQTSPTRFPTVPVFVNNQFGQTAPGDAVLIRRTEFCAPATVAF